MSEHVEPTYLLEVLEVRFNPKNRGQRIIGIAKNRHDAAEFIPRVKYPFRNAFNFSFYVDCDHDVDIQPGDVIAVRLEGSPTFKRWVLQKVIRNGVVVYPIVAEPDTGSVVSNTSSVNNTNQSSTGPFIYHPDPLPGSSLPSVSAPTTPLKPIANPSYGATSVSLPATPSIVQSTPCMQSSLGSATAQPPSSARTILYSAMLEEEAKAALRDSERDKQIALLTEQVAKMELKFNTMIRILREVRGIVREKKDYDDDDDEDPTEEDIRCGN